MLGDVGGPDGFSAEQQSSLNALGEEESTRIGNETNALIRQLLDEVLPTPSLSAQATKTCPGCAEDIKAAGHVCKHCGYRFN